jgi:hypothetical protein
MTNSGESRRTYIDLETNKFVTEDASGNTKEVIENEIEQTIQQWEKYDKEGTAQTKESNE